jgi:signal transduction histidine kinase
MARLYFRIYLAVLGSLALFAVLAGISLFALRDYDRFGPRPEFFQAVAERIAPASNLPPDAQRAVLEEWRRLSGYDVALIGANGRVLVEAGDGFAQFHTADGLDSTRKRWRGPHWAEAVQLTDGRWLVAARPHHMRGPYRRFGWVLALLGIAVAVGIAAYPMVRRLTRRLENLHQSVAALGSGDLSARVKVEGKDEVARLAETFNTAAARIQTLVTANKSLLANASHELRSPLARMRMGIEALPADTSGATREELARNIRELDQLIEEILLTSRIDAGNTETIAFEKLDIVGLVAEECAWMNAALHITTAEPPDVIGDPRLLRRLVRNLLENARRYGGSTAPDVTIQKTPGGDVVLDVCDRGNGVPEDERERIFEPFYRAKGAREREGGVGLGLALVRQIAVQHGGSVTCLPRDGGGSCFRVVLRVAV